MPRKTLFISSFHAHVSRNILISGVLDLLNAYNDLLIVILVPEYKKDYFQKNFGGKNILVEGVSLYSASKSKRGLFFKRFAEVLMPSKTRFIKQRYKLHNDGNFFHFLFFLASNALGRSFFARKLIRYADLKFSPKGFFYCLFDKYKPDAVFSTDLHNENDVSLMQDARRKGIHVIGMFRSWDNPTQGVLRVFPDKLLAGSKAILDETLKMQGYPENQIITTGHPHYDKYLKGPTKSKKEFFYDFGLDPKKPLIFFTPLGDKFVKKNDIDQHAMEVLGAMRGIQVLVRFPPDEAVTLKNFEKPANMVLHQPGVVFHQNKFEDRELKKEDDESLINSIYWSDVVITGPTSIILDAAFFDKPVIAAHLLASKRHYFDTVYCFDFSHVAKALATGGVKYVKDKEEFARTINEYLSNPERDGVGRENVRQMWFSCADGKSAARVAGEITRFLGL